MLGRIDHTKKEAVVIGGGIAGLLAAYRLLDAGFVVELFEKNDRLGGLISTSQGPHGLIEHAAHSIRSSSAVMRLFQDLGLPHVEAKTKRKFICRDGRLRGNPLSLWEMFAAGAYGSFKKSDGHALILADWATQHVGPAAVDYALAPLAHGIYAAEPEELDQQLAFPRMTIPAGKTLVETAFKKKSGAEKSIVIAPRDGMGALAAALTRFIGTHPQATVHLNSELRDLPRAANTVVATPMQSAATLTGMNDLAALRYAPMVSATVFVDSHDLDIKPGIGVLMARGDDAKLLGILFNSLTFDNRAASGDTLSLTAMLGGTGHAEILDWPDEKIETAIADELRRLFAFRGALKSVHITRWPRAIPLYSADLREKLDYARAGWCADAGRVLFGNYTGEVSIRGMCASSLALADA